MKQFIFILWISIVYYFGIREVRNALISKVWISTISRSAYQNNTKAVERVSVRFFDNFTGVCATGLDINNKENRLSTFNWKLNETDDGETNIIIYPNEVFYRGANVSSLAQFMFMKNNMYNVRVLNSGNNANLRFTPAGSNKENETLYLYFE